MAEVLRIRARIPGIANAGDFVVYDPDHPNPTLRLCRLVPLAPNSLPVIRAHITRYSSCHQGPHGQVPEGFLGLKAL